MDTKFRNAMLVIAFVVGIVLAIPVAEAFKVAAIAAGVSFATVGILTRQFAMNRSLEQDRLNFEKVQFRQQLYGSFYLPLVVAAMQEDEEIRALVTKELHSCSSMTAWRRIEESFPDKVQSLLQLRGDLNVHGSLPARRND